jgi:hypothetical protein
MKSIRIFAILLLIPGSFCFIMCSKDNNPEKKPASTINFDSISFDHSMKGWELYSWPDGNSWKYSILEGTNRLKTYEEVTGNKIIVSGEDSLKLLLNKFPANEEIFWISEEWLYRLWNGNYKNLSLPSESIINEITEYCHQKELILTVNY